MAENSVSAAQAEDKSLVVEWFEEALYHAIEPLKVAVDRLFWHHQDDMEVVDSLMLLERLIVSAEKRLKEFDAQVQEHHGHVGLLQPKTKFPGMDPRRVVGVQFFPKKEPDAAPAGADLPA